MIEHISPISGVAVGTGQYIATAGYDNQVILWRGRNFVARAYHDHLVNQCAFSRDGYLLVTASSDYTARVWSVPNLRLLSVLGNHEDDVEMAIFDPEGRRIATACRDRKVRVFDLNGKMQLQLDGHDADVLSVNWTENGQQLLSSSDDGTVRRWCAIKGELLDCIDMGGVETDSVAIARDGILYAGTDRGEIIIISRGDKTAIRAHNAGIKRLILDPENRNLLSASYDRTLCIWSVNGSKIQLTQKTTIPAVVWARSAAFDKSGEVITGTFGSSYAVYNPISNFWNFDGIQATPGFNTVLCVNGSIYSVGDAGRVLKDGSLLKDIGSLCNFLVWWQGRLVTGGHLGILFDCATGTHLIQHHSPLNCAVVLDSGALLVGTYTGDGLLLVVDNDIVRVERIVPLHEQAVKAIASFGKMVASVSAAGDLALLRHIDEEPIQRISRAHNRIANGICSLADGRFASVSRDRLLRIWSYDIAEIISTPHIRSIKCVVSSTNGRWIGTGSYDGTIAFYDLTLKCWGPTFRPTCAGISSLSRFMDADSFLASSYDGHIYALDPNNSSYFLVH